MSRLLSVVASVVVAACAAPAIAQVAPPTMKPQRAERQAGEIVMTRSGELVAPWKQVKVCRGKSTECTAAIVNQSTRETARVGEKWSSVFEPTGLGNEVKRAETVPQRVRRLQVGGPPKAPKKN